MTYILEKLRDPTLIPRRLKNAAFMVLDLFWLLISLWMAYFFRLGIDGTLNLVGPENPFPYLTWFGAAAVFSVSATVVVVARLFALRLHSFDLNAVYRIALVGLALLAALSLNAYFNGLAIPRSVAIYFPLTFAALAILSRLAILSSSRLFQNSGRSRDPVAIYGAGLAGIQLAASLKRSREVYPVGFVDDNKSLNGVIVSGLTVGGADLLERWARQGRIKSVLIATNSFPRAKRNALVTQMKPHGVEVQTIPSYIDLISKRSTVTDLRPVTPDQLLGRDTVDLNVPEIAKAYAGRSVMVTGAGGSIGSELCRQLVNCKPRKIVLFERSEFALYEIERQLRAICEAAEIALTTSLASVTDPAAVDEVIASENIDIILHAAAYKHVPLVECNEVEGARNNALGTQTIATAAARAAIERFILVSTDKAVRPTNVMGATKRMAELVVGDLQQRFPQTRFSMVRFGNVLGSSGSVIPLFRSQIEAGGPLTVTDERVTRYFMTIPEAARLVLLAGAFAEGSDLFVLNMGEPVRIIDLARNMVEMSGQTIRDPDNPEGDISIDIIGLRPGEKLYEELLIDNASLTDTPHEKIMRVNFEGLSQIEVAAMLKKTRDAVKTRDKYLIRYLVSQYVEGYSSIDQETNG